MANTTNFGWETPDDTDLVKDGAAAIRTLGSAIDASLADLEGGTTGQILSKTSNTDMDFTWITNDVGDITAVTAGTGISGGGTSGAVTITNSMATEITAAGDIIVGTGSGTFDNLPIGTTNQVLTADTTVSPYKVKWATASGSVPANATDTVSTANDVTSNSYTDPATSGPAVTLTTGTKALVIVTCNQKSVTANKKSFMGYAVSGSTTISATDTTALTKTQEVTNYGNERASAASVVTLTAGSNTFTAKYKTTDSDISTFADRTIFVMNLA